MNAELKSYIKECDCPEIQNKWKPKVGDCCSAYQFTGINEESSYYNPFLITKIENDLIWLNKAETNPSAKSQFIFLPSLEQLIEIMGKRFMVLEPDRRKGFLCWWKTINKILLLRKWGKTPKLACIGAVKEIKTENK